jgi:hypothetical protein
MDLIDKINNDIVEAEKNNDPLLSVYKDIKRAATELHVHSGAGHAKVYDSTVILAIGTYLAEGGNKIARKYLLNEESSITWIEGEEPELDVEPFLPIIEIPAVPMEESSEPVEESLISDPIQTIDFTKESSENVEIPDFDAALKPLQKHLSNTEIVNPAGEAEETSEQAEATKTEPKKRGRKPKNVEQN